MTLDLVIATSSLIQSSVWQLPTIGGSDHQAQMIYSLMMTIADVRHGKIKKTLFDLMSSILSSIDWLIAFVGCTDMNSYTVVFMQS